MELVFEKKRMFTLLSYQECRKRDDDDDDDNNCDDGGRKNGARNSNMKQQHTVFNLVGILFDFIVYFRSKKNAHTNNEPIPIPK